MTVRTFSVRSVRVTKHQFTVHRGCHCRVSTIFIMPSNRLRGESEDFRDSVGPRASPQAPHSAYHRVLARLVYTIEQNSGLLYVVASQACFSAMNVSVKVLNSLDPPVPTMEIINVRMVITYICCMLYMLLRKVEDPWLGPKGVRILLVLRGFGGFFGLFGMYYSLQYLSVSDATVITFLAPLSTALAGSILLGENFTRKEIFAGLLSLFGVVLIARPAFLFGFMVDQDGQPQSDSPDKGNSAQRLGAVGIALFGVIGSTCAYISLRAIGTRAHSMHSTTSFAAQCVLVSTLGMSVSRTPIVVPTSLDWMALLFLIGIFGFIGQTFLAIGLQKETAGRGAMAIYTQIIFAGALEHIFLRSTPSLLSTLGTIIIISSAIYVAMTKKTEVSATKSVTLQDIDDSAERGLLNSGDEHPELNDELSFPPKPQ
ncbi:hypothetical protein HGRIS_010827 [Hohenbuehelia grisea]|uniref:EamA domain-containing protein n=1 Tax=Hohenbuehelia grisea TaxID=104357 RepID=A0ABR3IY16_9AGAR